MEPGKEYYAFISYKREDEKWAKWFQKKLEYYKLPIEIIRTRPELPQFLRPIFKDTTDLNGDTLYGSINAALDKSLYLIVICSPNVLKSNWVSKEVQYFIDKGKEKYIIPVVVDGTPFSDDPAFECIPANIRNLQGDRELLCVNLADDGREAAVTRVVSRMTGISYDSLWQRHNREQKLRTNLKIAILSVMLIIAAALALMFMLKNIKIKEQNWQILKTQSVVVADMAKRLSDNGDSFTATMLALEVLPNNLLRPERPYTPEAEKALRDAVSSRCGLFKGHTDRVYSATMTKDGSLLISGSADSTIRFWDIRNGECLNILAEHNDIVRHVELSPSESMLLSWDFKDSIRIWDMTTMRDSCTIDCSVIGGDLMWAHFAKNESSVISFQGNTLAVWDLVSGQCLSKTRFKFNESVFYNCEFVGDKYVLISHISGKHSLYDIATGDILRTFVAEEAVLSTNEDNIALLYESGEVEVYDMITGDRLMKAEVDPRNSIMTFSPDGTKLAFASATIYHGSSYYSTIEVLDANTGKSITTFPGHHSCLEEIRWSFDGNYLLTSADDNCIGMWYVGCEERREVEVIDSEVLGWTSLAKYSFSGTKLVYSFGDTIKIKDVGINKPSTMISYGSAVEEKYYLDDIAFTKDDEMILAIFNTGFLHPNDGESSSAIVKFWSAVNGEPVHSLYVDYEIDCMKLAPDNKLFAVGSKRHSRVTKFEDGFAYWIDDQAEECPIYVWDMIDEWKCMKLSGHTSDVNSIVFFEDCSKMVSCSNDGKIIIWNTVTGELIKKLQGHSGAVTSILLTPDGTHVISCSVDETIRVWNVDSGKCEHVLHAHKASIYSLVMSNDKSLFASMSDDGTIKMWSIGDFQLLYTINVLSPDDMAYSYDDKYFYVSNSMGNINVYDVNTGGCISSYRDMGTHLSSNPNFGMLLSSGSRGIIELQMEPLQDLIEYAQNLYRYRELTNEERVKYYLQPRN